MDPDEVRKKKKRDQEVKNKIKKMSKEALAMAISKKKECNSRAMLIVEQLIEPNVQEVYLLENLKHINQSHFQDIVEERAITRSCGYPLCDEELTNVPKKIYKISTRENKVYDITDRKNYCSNVCYKAGTFLKDQLYTSPLWLRDCETPVEYQILSATKAKNCAGAGAEIDLGNTKPVKLDKKIDGDKDLDTSKSELSVTKESILKHKYPLPMSNAGGKEKDNMCDSAVTNCETNKANVPNESSSQTNIEANIISTPQLQSKDSDFPLNCISDRQVSNSPTCVISDNICLLKDMDIAEVKKQSDESQCNLKLKNSENNKIESSSNELFGTENKIESKDQTFSTEVCNTDSVKNTTNSNNTSELNLSSEHSNNDNLSKPEMNKSRKPKLKKGKKPFEKDCSPLVTVISELEKKIESWFTLETMLYLLGQKRLRELLNISGFKEDMPPKKEDHLIYLKCQEIYRRLNILEIQDKEKEIPSKPVPDYDELQEEAKELELKVKSFFRGDAKVTFADDTEEGKDKESGLEDDLPVLPLVDHCSVMLTRRRIFMDRLNKVLPDMQEALDLAHFRLGCEIQELVSTFSLGPTNIIMRPPEWTLVAVLIIKLLTIRNDILNFSYSQELTQRRLMTYLLTFDLDGGYLDRFTSYLMDVERVTADMDIK